MHTGRSQNIWLKGVIRIWGFYTIWRGRKEEDQDTCWKMSSGNDTWTLRRRHGTLWWLCDHFCLVWYGDFWSPEIRVSLLLQLLRRGFMTIEYFWEAPFLGNKKLQVLKMPSAQNNFPAIVAHSGLLPKVRQAFMVQNEAASSLSLTFYWKSSECLPLLPPPRRVQTEKLWTFWLFPLPLSGSSREIVFFQHTGLALQESNV